MDRSELENIILEELDSILEARYTSAGTVPRIQNRKMTPAQVAKREKLGARILKVIKTGGDKNPLRKAFKRWAAKNDYPITSEDVMNSYAWAMASDWAIKGKPFPPAKSSGKSSSKGPSKKKSAASAGKSAPKKAAAPAKKKAAKKVVKKKTKKTSKASPAKAAATKSKVKAIKKKAPAGKKKAAKKKATKKKGTSLKEILGLITNPGELL